MGTAQQPEDMTSIAKSANEDCSLEKHPLCTKHLRKAPEVNNVCTWAAGEVPCDHCVEPKQKAKKSCLVCLASYCSTHLNNHYSAERLKGHKLVEPVENLDARACLTHGYPLEVYSRKRQMCICARCLDGGQEAVVSAEVEWQKKKNEIENTKAELQHRIRTRQTKIDEINEALKSCKEHIENEWWDIDALFTAVLTIVKAAKAKALNPLEDKFQLLNKESKKLKEELADEINKLEATISKLDDISELEDHILFLQRYPSLSVQHDIKDWTDVELDTSLSFGSMRETTTTMVENIQQELEKLATIELMRFPNFTVDVTLDPDTAHQRLFFSDDRSKVKDRGENLEVADSLKRFDVLGSVLGFNSLTTGKSYWEVEVSNKTGWDLGVARGSADRRGRLTLNPENGYWVLVHFEECDTPKPYAAYAAMTAPPLILSLKDKPQKVGVFVDYEEGLVSFYDVTARSHIYSFSKCSFKDKLYPYFSLHMKYEINSEPLVISKIKHSNILTFCSARVFTTDDTRPNFIL